MLLVYICNTVVTKTTKGDVKMNGKHIYEKYYKRMSQEGWIKALLIGLIVGFAANVAAAITCWTLAGFFSLKTYGWIICVGTFLGCTGITTPILYLACFKPNDRKIARRVDSLGLAERLITRLWLNNRNDYIAQAQRADTEAAIAGFAASSIKFVISKGLIIACSILAASGIALSSVAIVAAEGGGPSLGEVIGGIKGEEPVTIIYLAEEGGFIDGDSMPEIPYGGDGPVVMAVAEDGWFFECWSDGYEDPVRQDLGVTEDAEYTAIFVSMEGDGLADGEGEGEDGAEEGDQPDDAPLSDDESKPGNSDGETPPPSDIPPSNEESEGEIFVGNGEIIDGNTQYGDVLGDYMGETDGESGDLPPSLGNVTDGYFDTLG